MFKGGAEHPNWKGDKALYRSKHWRVYRKRGKAAEYPCTDCREPAHHWSQIHGTSGSDPEHYQPRCRRCHMGYDREAYLNRDLTTRPRGEDIVKAKLTADKVRKIRALAADGWFQHDIAAHIGDISKTAVGDILRGKTWRHVT